MKYKEVSFTGNEEGVVDIPDDAIIVSSTIREGMDIKESRLVVTALVTVEEED